MFALVLPLENPEDYFYMFFSRRLLYLWSQISTDSRAKAVQVGKSVNSLSERLQNILCNNWLTQTTTIVWNFNVEFMSIPTQFQCKISFRTWALGSLIWKLVKDKWLTEKQEDITTTTKWEDFFILILRSCSDLRWKEETDDCRHSDILVTKSQEWQWTFHSIIYYQRWAYYSQ